MEPSLRKEAEERLGRALLETGARDPRESYRGMLRELRLRDEAEYEETVAVFEKTVLGAIVEEGAEPLGSWLEFGRDLSRRLHPGRDVVIDETGRARAFSPPASWQDLILHLPDDLRAKAVLVGAPSDLTGAQRASVDLLALGSVRLPDR